MYPLWFYFRRISDSTASSRCFLLVCLHSLGQSYLGYVVVPVTLWLPTHLIPYILLNLSLVHTVSWWCGSCGFPVTTSSYLVPFHLCSGECYQCCDFNTLGWGLSWSLASKFWLNSHNGVILLSIIPLRLLFYLHCFNHCNCLLWLGLMYLPLAVIFPQLCHCRI